MIPGQPTLVTDYRSALPPRITAGDSLAFSVTTTLAIGASVFLVLTGVIAGVPTRYNLGGNGIAVDFSGTAAFVLPSATSATWLPGRYTWVLLAIDASGDRSQLSSGVVFIDPDPAGVNVADPRTYNEKLLDAIKATLLGKAPDDVLMYKVGGRELTKTPVKDLEWWMGIVESRVRRERIRKGQRVPTRSVGISFGGRSGPLYPGFTLPAAPAAAVPDPSTAGPFVFVQSTPAAVWSIQHNLGRLPSVTVVDNTGSTVEPDIQYDSPNHLTLTFSIPIIGTAILT